MRRRGKDEREQRDEQAGQAATDAGGPYAIGG
jgi:hypothetical protein